MDQGGGEKVSGTRRIRVELATEDWETIKYFNLLRGQPMARGISRMLAVYAEALRKEHPVVKAHVFAWTQAHLNQPLSDNDLEAIPF